MLKFRATQGVAILGVAGAAGLAWDTYQQAGVAWEMFNDPTLQGTLLPHMQTGVAIGRIGQTTAVGVSSVAQLTTFNLAASRVLVPAANAALLPVTFVAEGLRLATAYYEFNLGRISQRDLYRRATPTAVSAGATTAGAIVGAIAAFPAGGVAAGAGAWAGAKIGFIIGIPFQLGADYLLGWYYREFDTEQRRRVDEAVYRHYGLEAANGAGPH